MADIEGTIFMHLKHWKITEWVIARQLQYLELTDDGPMETPINVLVRCPDTGKPFTFASMREADSFIENWQISEAEQGRHSPKLIAVAFSFEPV